MPFAFACLLALLSLSAPQTPAQSASPELVGKISDELKITPKQAEGGASVAGTFKQLGMSPDMATKMVPVLTSFVQSKGASGAAKLLMGALK